MKKGWLLFGCLACCLSAFSQNAVSGINPTDEADSLIINKFYFSSFKPARIVYKDRTVAAAPLNYNLLNGEMEFINPHGDTLSVTEEISISYITIETDTFFYDKKFLQLLSGNGNIELARHLEVKLIDVKRTGAYGVVTQTPGVTFYSTINTQGETVKLPEPGTALYKLTPSYYFGDAYDHFQPATKKNVLKIMNGKEKDVEAYLNTNKINFKAEKDLRQLMDYLQIVSN